jgi:hypothetical protein
VAEVRIEHSFSDWSGWGGLDDQCRVRDDYGRRIGGVERTVSAESASEKGRVRRTPTPRPNGRGADAEPRAAEPGGTRGLGRLLGRGRLRYLSRW